MPLVKGKKAATKKGFSDNVRREMHEGKKQSQAVAIAYSEARHGKEHKNKADHHHKEAMSHLKSHMTHMKALHKMAKKAHKSK